uniref:UBN2 domain-containing protein n=1 Tax=Vitis vinifera TaxID=29760 RepID=A5AJ86_VITVI|nr:hypothetical protein VITISV_025677 [Vitis vinifera]
MDFGKMDFGKMSPQIQTLWPATTCLAAWGPLEPATSFWSLVSAVAWGYRWRGDCWQIGGLATSINSPYVRRGRLGECTIRLGFIVIVNELEALGKTYTEVEKVMKILRSLPKKWETKVTVIQEANDLTKLSLEELIGSLITCEIELYNHQRVEENEKSIAFMALINDDEEEESESESDEDSIEEECTNEDANTCFMALEEHQDEVNSNSNHFEFQDVLQKLYFDLEKLDFKNSYLQNELNEHNENFENIEKAKISFEKENEELKILKWPKDF